MSFDFRAREFAVMTGTLAGRRLRLRAARLRQRSHVLARRRRRRARHPVLQDATTWSRTRARRSGKNLPFWMENTAGGPTCAATSTSSSAATASSRRTSSTTSRCSRSARWISARSASTTSRRSGSGTCRRPARLGCTPCATPPTSARFLVDAQRVAEGRGLPAGPRPAPVGRRRAALLPPLGRGPADRVRRRLGYRVPDLALHADRRRLKLPYMSESCHFEVLKVQHLHARADNNFPCYQLVNQPPRIWIGGCSSWQPMSTVPFDATGARHRPIGAALPIDWRRAPARRGAAAAAAGCCSATWTGR